jgi:hypothetical protein
VATLIKKARVLPQIFGLCGLAALAYVRGLTSAVRSQGGTKFIASLSGLSHVCL